MSIMSPTEVNAWPMPSVSDTAPCGKIGMRNTARTKMMAQRLAIIFRMANQFITRIPNFPVLRLVNILARDGERIRKMATGAT